VVYISSNGAEKLKEAGQKVTAGIYFYVNGKFDYAQYFPVPMFGIRNTKQNSLPLRIGRAGSGNAFFHGMIDDVSVWNKALSETEIQRLMFERLGGNEDGLQGYWSFNEGEGTVTRDHTKNKNDGHIGGKSIEWVSSEEKGLILNPCI